MSVKLPIIKEPHPQPLPAGGEGRQSTALAGWGSPGLISNQAEMILRLEIIINNNHLPNIYPGEILQLEFLEPLNITPYRLSKDIGVTQTRISEILSGKCTITADTALRLSRYFGNSAQFWLNLQTQYDIRQALEENAEVYNQIQFY